MPLLGFGTWELKGDEAYRAIRIALDAGYRHLDTATFYENEVEVGRAIADSGVPRSELFVTTKLAPSDAGRERDAIEASLRRLRTGYVDLWLIHHPPSDDALLACWSGVIDARQRGLARAIGVSNHSLAQVDTLRVGSGVPPAVNQLRWGTTIHDEATLDEHRRRAIVVEGYHPFRASDLEHPVIRAVAEHHGASTAQVVLRWHVQHGIPTIPKSGRPDRIVANFDIAGLALSDDEMAAIDATSGFTHLRP